MKKKISQGEQRCRELIEYLKICKNLDDYIFIYISSPLIKKPMVKFSCTPDFKQRVIIQMHKKFLKMGGGL